MEINAVGIAFERDDVAVETFVVVMRITRIEEDNLRRKVMMDALYGEIFFCLLSLYIFKSSLARGA